MVPSEVFFYALLPKVVFSYLKFIKGPKSGVYKVLIVAVWCFMSQKVNKQLTYEKNVNIPNDRLWMTYVWR